MTRIVCIANQKGGVGKTTTAGNLAVGTAKSGSQSLLVDLDPQCNSTTGFGVRPLEAHPLAQQQPLRDSIVQTASARLDLLPGSRSFNDTSRLEDSDVLSVHCHLDGGVASYDFVFIDCPPSLGRLTEAALTASTEVLMPIQCEYFAMEGLTQMIQVSRRVMEEGKNSLEFGGILLTMYDPALQLTREVDDEVRDFFGDIVFDTVIPRDVAVSEAPSHGLAALDYAPRSVGARAYIELCMEVLDRE